METLINPFFGAAASGLYVPATFTRNLIGRLRALLDDPDISSGLACEFGLFWSMMQRDTTKKGILGLLTDDRAYRRASAGVPAVNAFALGCVLDVGCVYRTLDGIIAHLQGWQAGRRMPVGPRVYIQCGRNASPAWTSGIRPARRRMAATAESV